jgi:hypothetical protein
MTLKRTSCYWNAFSKPQQLVKCQSHLTWLLLHTQDVPGSNLRLETWQVSHDLPQSFQANTRTEPKIRSQLLPSISVISHPLIILPLTREGSGLKPSHSVLVLQCGSGPYGQNIRCWHSTVSSQYAVILSTLFTWALLLPGFVVILLCRTYYFYIYIDFVMLFSHT